jgi:cystathionine beta-lyase/cystathionine gamma-synthase
MAAPDLGRVIAALATQPDPVHLVIDNTGLSCSFQPFRLLPAGAAHLRVIAFDSLTKYGQFGLDRATAGMIVAPAEHGGELDARREHLGTNVTDTSVNVIPFPHRARLELRLSRLGRNAGTLAARLQAHAEAHPGSPLRGARHPGLPGHPSHPHMAPASFRGGFFSLELAPRFECDQSRAAFLRLALDEAERRAVPLAAGASFGLNTTRLYVTASNSDPARAFIRVSPGTEHRLQVETLGDAFECALDRMADEPPAR